MKQHRETPSDRGPTKPRKQQLYNEKREKPSTLDGDVGGRSTPYGGKSVATSDSLLVEEDVTPGLPSPPPAERPRAVGSQA